MSLLCLLLAKTQCPHQGETNQFEANHDDKLGVKEMELWNPPSHDVSPTSKELVSFALHGSCSCIKEDRILVAHETELLRPGGG